MRYILTVQFGDQRVLDVPAGAEVVVIFPTKLGLRAANGLEATVDLPRVTAIVDEFAADYLVATGVTLRSYEDEDAATNRAAMPVLTVPAPHPLDGVHGR